MRLKPTVRLVLWSLAALVMVGGAAGLAAKDLPGIDLTKRLGRVSFDGVKIGRDDGSDLAELKSLVRHMGQAGIPILCYNFMAGTDWFTPAISGTGTSAMEAAIANTVQPGMRAVAVVNGYSILGPWAIQAGPLASAPLHLAQAAGVPTVAIFGPTVPAFGFGPRGPRDVVVEHAALRCRPCSRHGPRTCPLGHHRCLRDIDVNEVLLAVETTGALSRAV